MKIPTRCPECGDRFVLREDGSYGGYQLLNNDGTIVPDSYKELFCDGDRSMLYCLSCGYEDREIVTWDDRVLSYDEFRQYMQEARKKRDGVS